MPRTRIFEHFSFTRFLVSITNMNQINICINNKLIIDLTNSNNNAVTIFRLILVLITEIAKKCQNIKDSKLMPIHYDANKIA